MTRFYIILSVAGWAWLVIAGIYLIWKFSRMRPRSLEAARSSGQGQELPQGTDKNLDEQR